MLVLLALLGLQEQLELTLQFKALLGLQEILVLKAPLEPQELIRLYRVLQALLDLLVKLDLREFRAFKVYRE
jgi:hypothetical protein